MTTLKDETEDDEDTTQTTFESVSKTSTPNTVSQRTQSFTKTSFFRSESGHEFKWFPSKNEASNWLTGSANQMAWFWREMVGIHFSISDKIDLKNAP